MCLGGNLSVETRCNRLPPEMRLRTCDKCAVQTEEHVLLVCSLSHNFKQIYSSLGFTNKKILIEINDNGKGLCTYDDMNSYALYE